MEVSRRTMLAGIAATAAVASLPIAISEAVPAAATEEIVPAWVVGTEGEFDWQHIIAKTQREALRIYASDNGDYEEECNHEDYQEDCDCCNAIGGFEATRVKTWDGLKVATPGDWLRAGLGHICSRCSYETFREESGHPVGDEAVCADCMTLADWDIVDPERAAELRAEDDNA